MNQILNHSNCLITTNEKNYKTLVECKDMPTFDRMVVALSQYLGNEALSLDKTELKIDVDSPNLDHYELVMSYVEMAKMIFERSEPEKIGKWNGV